ncbi:MAG: RelA/SpoT domain-containing protein [Actinobacteria bacterium]|nr:RelA/SpoT domain-containing protein [Actinomycetota bacterium]
MNHVSSVLRDELNLRNTSRLKTEGTLVDKLRREGTNLTNMDDIAGVRLEPVADRAEQDHVAALILRRFPQHRVKDRRAEPNVGYRAVHVIVKEAGYRVEVQIRTKSQHQWAELNEKLADSAGRGLRYGERPADPDAAHLHSYLAQLAEFIDDYEDGEVTLRKLLHGSPPGLEDSQVVAHARQVQVNYREKIEEIVGMIDNAIAQYDAQRSEG